MSIDKTFENLVTAIQSLTEAVNRLAAQPVAEPAAAKQPVAEPAAAALVAAAPVATAPVAAAPVAAAPVAAAPVAAAPVAAAPAAAKQPAAASAAVAEPPASVDLQALTKKALELVKRDGGSKTRLLDAMHSVDPDATSIPTIKPELYADVYNAIDAVLSL